MKTADVLGIGVALVDYLSFVSDRQLESMHLAKGTMKLIDHDELTQIQKLISPDSIQSGGSVANTIVQLASLGSQCHFIGKVAGDDTGSKFRKDMECVGVEFATALSESELPTGRCYVFVTPDAQRTMCTFLGAGTSLAISDVDADAIANVRYMFVEGYLWDSPSAKQMIAEKTAIAIQSDTAISLTLSDPLLVDRHREHLQDYVENYVDLLICNEFEALQMYRSKSLDDAVELLRKKVMTLVVTKGEYGSLVVCGDETHVRNATRICDVKDTTGAGDAYAAGFLHGFARQLPITDCMTIGSDLASEVVQHMGGRIDSS